MEDSIVMNSNEKDAGSQYVIPQKYANDENQRRVIELETGRNLVLAPAGCGKTDILAERVARAIELGVAKEDMAILTFTNRASREMKERIESRINEDVDDTLFVGNIHRYCTRLLFTQHAIPHDTHILQEEEIRDILSELLKDNGLDSKSAYDVLRYEHLLTQYRMKHPLRVILLKKKERADFRKQVEALCITTRREYSSNGILGISDDIETLIDTIDESDPAKNTARLFLAAKRYSQYKKEHSLIDFDDVLILGYTYLCQNEGTLRKKKWIQVDEVQDLNALQLDIIEKMADADTTILYLGNSWQSIFSFLGADEESLNRIKESCTGIYRLSTNYRSPKYLVDMLNAFATKNLGAKQEDLIASSCEAEKEPGAMTIRTAQFQQPDYCRESDHYTLAFQTAVGFPEDGGRTAIIVPTNAAADNVSAIFTQNNVPHFKVSGQDVFATDTVELLMAHLRSVYNDSDFLAWSRIFWKMTKRSSKSDARKGIDMLRHQAFLPSDLLSGDSVYALDFLVAARNEYVVFDTESTGLNVRTEDIMQIAACKVKAGKIVDRFNVFLEGDASRIPAMLKDKPNPLVVQYPTQRHIPRKQALEQFLTFVGDSPLFGHNVEYDYRLLDFNIRRDCGRKDFTETHPYYFDTLKMARLLLPGQKNYKLESLIRLLSLRGANTHLANDDVEATKLLVDSLLDKENDIAAMQVKYLKQITNISFIFREHYATSYHRARKALYEVPNNPVEPALVHELKAAYEDFLAKELIEPCDKFNYICDYLSNDLLAGKWNLSLKEQLDGYLHDIETLKEIDLCSSDIVKEKYFISTVHKAKGLGFENVIVTDVTDQTYPSFQSKDEKAKAEDARKFYVALSRAKKRLCLISYKHYSGNGWKKDVGDSPFLTAIKDYFV